MQSPALSLATDRSFSHVAPGRTKSRRQPPRKLPTDTDIEDEESDDNLSSDDEDDDHEEDRNWPQQWNTEVEVNPMQARQSSSSHYGMSPIELDHLNSPLPSDVMMPFQSFDGLFPDQAGYALGDGQTLEQASSQSYTSGQV